MKTINKVCQILALLTGIAAAVLFFTDFATIVSDSVGSFTASGAQLCFGAKISEVGIDMHKSSKLLFVFLLTLLTVVFGGFSFKSKGAKWGTVVTSAIAAVFMLVVRLSKPIKFVDADAVESVTAINYEATVLIITVLLFVTLIASVAHLLINDRIVCAGKKPTIPKKVVAFLKDYKSESKKIVWPTFKDVVKNTVIVLIMCVVVGAFIWLLDLGLSQLLKLLWK